MRIVQHTLNHSSEAAANHIIGRLAEAGIKATWAPNKVNFMNRILSIELPEDITDEDLISLGALIGTIQSNY